MSHPFCLFYTCAKHKTKYLVNCMDCETDRAIARREDFTVIPLPSGDFKVNALGEPSPNRTDFKDWSRENLEAFARQAADENLVLQANVAALLAQWRDVTIAVAEEREACAALADTGTGLRHVGDAIRARG